MTTTPTCGDGLILSGGVCQTPQEDCEDNQLGPTSPSIWLGGQCLTVNEATTYCSTNYHTTLSTTNRECNTGSGSCLTGYEWTGPPTGGGCTLIPTQTPQEDCEDNQLGPTSPSIWLGGQCLTVNEATTYCSTNYHTTLSTTNRECNTGSGSCLTGYEWTGPPTGGGCTLIPTQTPQEDCEDNQLGPTSPSIWLGGQCLTVNEATTYCSTNYHTTLSTTNRECNTGSGSCLTGYEWTGPPTGGGCTLIPTQTPQEDCEDNQLGPTSPSIWLGGQCLTVNEATTYCSTNYHTTLSTLLTGNVILAPAAVLLAMSGLVLLPVVVVL